MEPVSSDPLIGVVLAGKYRILERIGLGGMSAVYRAEHLVMDRPVAVKILSKELTYEDISQKRFLAEARIACQITHPNAVTLFDAGVQDDLPYLVMEYLRGITLKEEIRSKGPLPPPRAVFVMDQVCAALRDAHEHGIIHRDLKPSNIMLIGNDRVKVLDFGIAKMINPVANIPSELTVVGSLVGTPHYMSPEQGLSKAITNKSDIYSLGIILYEMLSGELPFDGPSSVAILIKHANEKPKPLRELGPQLGISAALDAVVMRCLAKNPEDRQEDVEQLSDELRTAVPIPEQPTLRRKPSGIIELDRKTARKRTAAAAAVVLLLSAAAVFYFAAPGRVPPPSGEGAVEDPAALERHQAELEALRRAQEEAEAAKIAAEEQVKKAQEEAEAARKAQEAQLRKAQEEAEAARKAQEEAEALWKVQIEHEASRRRAAQDQELRKRAADVQALQNAQEQIAALKRAQEEAQQARAAAEAAAERAKAEAEAAQKAREESEKARKAAETAKAAHREEAMAEARRKAEAELEAFKKAQAEKEQAARLADEAARKQRIESEKAQNVQSNQAAAGQAEDTAAKRAYEQAMAAKKAAEESARKLQAEAAALRRAEEARRRAEQEMQAREQALREKQVQLQKAQEAGKQVSPSPAGPAEGSEDPSAPKTKPRRRCGPTWCL